MCCLQTIVFGVWKSINMLCQALGSGFSFINSDTFHRYDYRRAKLWFSACFEKLSLMGTWIFMQMWRECWSCPGLKGSIHFLLAGYTFLLLSNVVWEVFCWTIWDLGKLSSEKDGSPCLVFFSLVSWDIDFLQTISPVLWSLDFWRHLFASSETQRHAGVWMLTDITLIACCLKGMSKTSTRYP